MSIVIPLYDSSHGLKIHGHIASPFYIKHYANSQKKTIY